MFHRLTTPVSFIFALVALSNFAVLALPGLNSPSRWASLSVLTGHSPVNHVIPGQILPSSFAPSGSSSSPNSELSSEDSSAASNSDDGDSEAPPPGTDSQSSTTPADPGSDSNTDDSSLSSSPPSPATNAALPTYIPAFAIPFAMMILYGLL